MLNSGTNLRGIPHAINQILASEFEGAIYHIINRDFVERGGMCFKGDMPEVKGPPPGSPHFNSLFFGCFSQLNAEEYCSEMEKVLQSDSSITTAMTMDIYGMGNVLYRKKYRCYSYGIFLTGLFVTFIALLFTTLR